MRIKSITPQGLKGLQLEKYTWYTFQSRVPNFQPIAAMSLTCQTRTEPGRGLQEVQSRQGRQCFSKSLKSSGHTGNRMTFSIVLACLALHIAGAQAVAPYVYLTNHTPHHSCTDTCALSRGKSLNELCATMSSQGEPAFTGLWNYGYVQNGISVEGSDGFSCFYIQLDDPAPAE